MTFAIRLATLAAAALCLSAPTFARDIHVRMKNRGSEGMMVFEPSFVRATPGDVIHFIPADPSHNAETIPGMAPKGTAPFKGAMSKPVDLKVAKEGLYGVRCMPNIGMGMVALIQVGKASPADIAAARAVKLPPLAARRMTTALAKVR